MSENVRSLLDLMEIFDKCVELCLVVESSEYGHEDKTAEAQGLLGFVKSKMDAILV